MNERISILLVEDNPGDAELTSEILESSNLRPKISVAKDGIEAVDFLRNPLSPRPNLILLDLNLPRRNGQEVLNEIKSDASLKQIPVIILTSSTSKSDILKSYDLGANCYLGKPVDLNGYYDIIRAVEGFWFKVVKLPNNHRKNSSS